MENPFHTASRATLAGTALACTCGLFVPSASAQAPTVPVARPSAVPSAKPEEVTVVALRHDTKLQRTSASVTVLSGATLQNAGATTLSEASRLVPNLDFRDGFRAGVPSISLRGIPTAQGGEAPVAVLIDGVQAPGLDFTNVDLVDIANIEVLRGPQGALYGRGAIAGALLINTVQPTNTFHFKQIVDYGNGNTIRVADTVSGPLIKDKLWAKATYQYKSSDGLIHDVGLGRAGDFYHEVYGNIELVAKPMDGTRIELQASHLKGTDGASYEEMVPGAGIYDFTTYQPDRNLPITDNRRLDH